MTRRVRVFTNIVSDEMSLVERPRATFRIDGPPSELKEELEQADNHWRAERFQEAVNLVEYWPDKNGNSIEAAQAKIDQILVDRCRVHFDEIAKCLQDFPNDYRQKALEAVGRAFEAGGHVRELKVRTTNFQKVLRDDKVIKGGATGRKNRKGGAANSHDSDTTEQQKWALREAMIKSVADLRGKPTTGKVLRTLGKAADATLENFEIQMKLVNLTLSRHALLKAYQRAKLRLKFS